MSEIVMTGDFEIGEGGVLLATLENPEITVLVENVDVEEES